MRSPILALSTASLLLAGCASKRYVSREVGEVNQKVDGLSTQMETTQDRVAATERRIEQVNQDADAGIQAASGAARQALTKADDAAQAAKGKLVYTVTLSDDKVKFPLNGAALSDDARKTLDEAIAPLAAENRGVYLEIEGHTDSTGPSDFNRLLGEERAEAVRDYLHDQEGIALARMQVISYGDSQPLVQNDTREHRAENRRVVIKVLE